MVCVFQAAPLVSAVADSTNENNSASFNLDPNKPGCQLNYITTSDGQTDANCRMLFSHLTRCKKKNPPYRRFTEKLIVGILRSRWTCSDLYAV